MIPLDPLFAVIESRRFAAVVNVASNLKTFLHALASQSQTQQLGAAIARDEAREQVAARIEELVVRSAPDGRESDSDTALATYLWLLCESDRGLARRAARVIVRCPGIWWARRVAEHILAASQQSSEHVGSEYDDIEIPYTEEEIRELAKQPRGRPLAEILAELARRAGG